ncbi:MAG: PEP-utilizing enzyme [Moorellales bacterium]
MGFAVEVNLTEGAVEWLPHRRLRRKDLERFWFHDFLHNEPPATPMGASLLHWPDGSRYAAVTLSYPYSHGYDYRLYYGRIYASPLPIEDPEEIRERERRFTSIVTDLFSRWSQWYSSCVREWVSLLEYLKGIRKELLSLPKLTEVLKETIEASKRAWELHFFGQYAALSAYTDFEELCLRNGISEKEIRTFLQGYDTKVYETDRALWGLANLAHDLGLEEAFVTAESTEALEKYLELSPRGRAWLKEFRDFLEYYGRRTTAAVFDPYYPTWREEPWPVLFTLKTYILKGGFSFEDHTRKVIEERDRAVQSTMARLGEQAAEDFRLRLGPAQATYPFFEDHNFYVDQWAYAELRYTLLECGRRLTEHRILARPEDVFFLTANELLDGMRSLSRGRPSPVGGLDLFIPQLVEERRQRWQELHDCHPPRVLGTSPEVEIRDPLFTKVWGFTRETIAALEAEEEDSGTSRRSSSRAVQLIGLPGSPGVAEGRARVILGYEGFSEVLPEEVLVAPFTTPAWTPLFSKVKAVVTDCGGLLAHAAICAREYGIPAVVGTTTRGQRATEMLRTGQYVRVNGSKGVVEVLSESTPVLPM